MIVRHSFLVFYHCGLICFLFSPTRMAILYVGVLLVKRRTLLTNCYCALYLHLWIWIWAEVEGDLRILSVA
jgi:hypothetical protein